MDDHDQLAALYQEQERDVEDALTRVGRGTSTAEDEATLRCALHLPVRTKRFTHKERHDVR